MWTKEFWLDCFERSIFAFAETMLGFMTITNSNINWLEALSVSGVAFLAAVFKAIIKQAIKDGKGNDR